MKPEAALGDLMLFLGACMTREGLRSPTPALP
jgi:hypothetical protein